MPSRKKPTERVRAGGPSETRRRTTPPEPEARVGGGEITHGLLIREEPLRAIFAGTKTWEMRGSATTRRGRIALIQSKSGHVVGACDVVDVIGPLTLAEYRRGARKHRGGRQNDLPYARTFAWVVRDARQFRAPIPYRHPSGAIIWVELDSRVAKAARRADRKPVMGLGDFESDVSDLATNRKHLARFGRE